MLKIKLTLIIIFDSIFGELTDGVSKSSDGATLTLSNVIPSDGGVYTCTASSTGGGTGFDSISVNVVGKKLLLCLNKIIVIIFTFIHS